MHRKILENATLEQLKEFVDRSIMIVKAKDLEMYNEIEMELYKEVYGCHFNQWLLECATEHMINEDGTTGPHYTLEQAMNIARQNSVMFDRFNEYDWCYVLNMVYSDYYGSVSNDTSSYAKIAKKFLDDKDAPKGKALHYYLAMKH